MNTFITSQRLRGLILLVLICLSSCLCAHAQGILINGIRYILYSGNVAHVVGATPNYGGYQGNVVIPSEVEYNGKTYTVIEIEEGCFKECSDLTSLTIPATVRYVGNRYQGETFIGCTALKKVIIEDGDNPILLHESKTGSTFIDSPVEEVYMGRNIEEILDRNGDSFTTNYSGFRDLKTLKTVVIGKKVTRIKRYCFNGCSSLESIVMPDSLSCINDWAFNYCTNLKNIQINADTIGKNAFSGCGFETVKLGDRVKIIGYAAFAPNPYLKEAFIGKNVVKVGDSAFGYKNSDTTSPNTIYLFSEELTSLGENGFPTTVARIFVPNPSRYQNLLKDYYLDKLITIDNSTSVYNGTSPDFSYTSNVPGVEVGFVPSTFKTDAGTYTSSVGVKFSKDNWSSTINVPCTYTITPAPLSVIANDANRQYGQDNPEMTCSFFGFKNNETSSVLSRQPVVETTATKNSSVGTYPIIVSGAEAKNYTFNYERGTLTITKADQEIEWNQNFGTVNVGDVMALSAVSSSGLPVKYSVTDESIAEIFTQQGKKCVEFLKAGKVSIRATQEGDGNYNEADRVSKTATVALLVNGITLDASSVKIKVGESCQLAATVSPADAANKTLTWSSSNTSVATVDQNGKVTAVRQGYATIKADAVDGSNVSAECRVQVVKTAERIQLNINSATLQEGQTISLIATIEPADVDDKGVVWKSSNASVASVGKDGIVSAHLKGEVIITATTTDGTNLSAICKINVDRPVADVVLSETELQMNKGEIKRITANVIPSDASNVMLNWTSSNEIVATVTGGYVQALAEGITLVSAASTDGTNRSASCLVKVVDNSALDTVDVNRIIVKSVGSVVYISGKEAADSVDVFNTQGLKILTTTDNEFALAQRGIFIICIGGTRHKIVV